MQTYFALTEENQSVPIVHTFHTKASRDAWLKRSDKRRPLTRAEKNRYRRNQSLRYDRMQDGMPYRSLIKNP